MLFTSLGGDFTGNDVIVTKTNGVLPYPLRNNPVKFHQDRMRFSRVIVFTSSGGDFTENDVTDEVIQYRVCIYSNNINPTKFGED